MTFHLIVWIDVICNLFPTRCCGKIFWDIWDFGNEVPRVTRLRKILLRLSLNMLAHWMESFYQSPKYDVCVSVSVCVPKVQICISVNGWQFHRASIGSQQNLWWCWVLIQWISHFYSNNCAKFPVNWNVCCC